jgi:hypothetical protein
VIARVHGEGFLSALLLVLDSFDGLVPDHFDGAAPPAGQLHQHSVQPCLHTQDGCISSRVDSNPRQFWRGRLSSQRARPISMDLRENRREAMSSLLSVSEALVEAKRWAEWL